VPDFVIERNTINNEIYGLPTYLSPWVMVYNKELFREAGLDANTPPSTMSDMLHAQAALTRTDDSGRVTQTGYFGQIQIWALNAIYSGNGFLNTPGYKASAYTEDFEQLITWNNSMTAIYGGLSDLDESFNRTLPGTFRNGNAAIMFDFQPLNWSGVDFEYGIAKTPCFNKQMCFTIGTQSDVFVMPYAGRNPDGAWHFIRWFFDIGLILERGAHFAENAGEDGVISGYFPRNIANYYTNTRVRTLFLPYAENNTITNVFRRDRLAGSINRFTSEFVIPDMPEVYSDNMTRVFAATTDAELGDATAQMQRELDRLTDEFIEERRAEGWIFDGRFDNYDFGVRGK
jgi:ABC-type glycerol-3-phosphate transport system substrate-binding protein